jgi:crossover junction endodeoxyribonuclease RuvC
MEKVTPEHTILGIDPGTSILGFGIIRIVGNRPSLVKMGVLRLHSLQGPFAKLGKIYEEVDSLIAEFQPHEVSIEAPFFGKDVQAMLKLGRAQGVAIAAAFNRGIPVFEYAPLKIKQSITGNGRASKEQVALMLKNLLRYEEAPAYLDATDAVAAALCHHFQSNLPVKGNGLKSWEEFVKKNPGRVR